MIWLIVTILVVLWVLGLTAEIGGALIHVLLLVAGVVLITRLVSGSRRWV